MADPFLSQITMFGGNFAPKKFAFCNGQTLAIAQNQALFSLLGTTYGGNGVTTFALPNLQSCLPVSFGQGPGLSNYVLGQVGGFQNVTLSQATVPPHQHFMLASTNASATTSASPNNMICGRPFAPGVTPHFYANPPGQGQPALIPHTLAAGTVVQQGGSQSHPNLMPSLCISFCICLQGVFPSRN
jgi:microcystin-dependent protein